MASMASMPNQSAINFFPTLEAPKVSRVKEVPVAVSIGYLSKL
jgi:hypothetical protein